MAGGGKGIEWMINLDARTKGATDVIAALSNTSSAADKAGRAIDQALAKMEGHKDFKQRLAAENAGWNSAISGAKQRIAVEENMARTIKGRTSMVALETLGLEKNREAAVTSTESLFGGVMKAELAMEGLKLAGELAFDAIKKTGEVLWDAVKAAAGSQRTGKVFENMLGKEGGKDTLEYLDKFAGLSEFTDDALKPMAATLLQVGVRGADFRNAIAAAADVAATSTDKLGGFSGAIESFTRIARTGRVDNRILAGLALNPHDVEAQLSKDLGMAPETIKKKLEEGTLKGVEAMDSIFTVMEAKSGKQLGSLGLEMADNLDSRLDKLKDVPDEIYKKLKSTQGFSDISDTIARITELLSPESEVGQRLFTALAGVIDVVGAKLKDVDWEHVANVVSDVVEKVTALIDPLLSVAGGIAKIAGYVAMPFRAVGGAAADVAGSAIGVGVAAYRGIRGDAANEDYINEMSRKNEDAWRASGADQALAARDAGDRVGKANIEGGKDALESHSPSRVWMRLGQDSMDGFRLGIDDGATGAQSAAASAIAPPSIGGMAAGIGAGGGSFTIAAGAVTIQVNVGGSGGSPQEIGKEAADQTASALLPILEQFAVQAGLA